ncbi:aldehyde dehydrogenase family protein [Alteromonas sp. ASW11-19]|uniref:Aldehyde dehydrogenase n=1 Tax=Alteromonas salexigens TaxID=2982530 RepID=A0ABT2VMM0_9ALTE|nr:aldehyde dehydrogenase family protein [Alteromonas salexigens]MCU7553229.1 aldehyde dehydrogenase family protein [Alteromonas salexigens]
MADQQDASLTAHQQQATQVQQALRATFAAGKTRDLSWRRQQLRALQALLNEHESEITEALHADLGKCRSESIVAEVGFLQADIKHTLKHLERWNKPRRVSTPMVAWPGKSYQYPEPLGTVLIIGAWNYPLQLLLAPFIAAVAAGNCAVLKPSELAAATSALVARLIPAYLDNDAVQVVEGGKDETSALLAMPWDHVFYTGGETVGKIVMAAAAKHLTPVTLELGGKSPCVVDTSTHLAVAARRIVWGKWMNAGQTCIAPDYVLVEAGLLPALVAAIKSEIIAQYGESALTNNDYGSIINARHLQRLQSYLAEQTLEYGGEVDVSACRMAPTLVVNPAPDSALMREEIFGPILPIVAVDTMEEAMGFINARPKPLALYLFTDDKHLEERVLANTSAGSVCINDTMMFMTNPNLPFGGVGSSGMGSYHGQAGFDTFSHLKTVMRRAFAFDVPFRYPPYTDLKLKILRKLL